MWCRSGSSRSGSSTGTRRWTWSGHRRTCAIPKPPVRTTDIIERPSDLTAEWLSAAVGAPVVDFGFERIGTGQMSECYRVSLRYGHEAGGPGSVVLKVAATDPMSRQTGLALGLYEREVRFYTDL